MKGKTVIIIGTDSDLVYQVASEFLKQNARVICTYQDKTKADRQRNKIIKQTGSKRIALRLVDLTSLESVRQFAESVNKYVKKLDILVNLVDRFDLPHMTTADGLQISMQVNYFSPFLLVNSLLDLLEKSGPSRIILTTSKLAKYGKIDIDNLNRNNRSLTIYNRTKLSLILFAKELSEKLTETECEVCCIAFDLGDTDFFSNLPLLVKKMICVSEKSKSVALIINEAKTEIPRKIEFDSGALAKRIAKYDHLKSQLWEISEKLVELSPFQRYSIS